MSDSLQQRLRDIAKGIDVLESNLPKRVDPVSISLKAKIPFKALLFREALIWRFTELARTALQHFTNQEPAAATTLTRATLETVAALWYLHRKIKSVIDMQTVGEVDTFLMRLGVGSKVNEAMPDPVNVLTFIKNVNNEIEGFQQQYDELSEFSHPNWAGTSMLYSVNNDEKLWTDFGKNAPILDSVNEVGTINLSIAIEMFQHSYNEVTDMMPEFIRICERDLQTREGTG